MLLLSTLYRTTGCSLTRRLCRQETLTRRYSTRAEFEDDSTRTVIRYKRIFGVTLCTLTVLGCAWLRRRKTDRMTVLLQDCVRLPLSPDLFEKTASMYRYKGYVFPGQIVYSGVLQELPSFQFRDEDVLVASYPKTGTTWVQEIVYMLTHESRASTESDQTLETRFPYLEYPYPGLKSMAAMPGGRCIKTHLPYSLLPPSLSATSAKVIYVTRNPRDTAVSYYHFVKLLTTSGFKGTLSDFINLFLKDEAPYSPFMNHVESYWAAQENNLTLLCITYEELSDNPAAVVKRIAQHLNIGLSEEQAQHIVSHTSFAVMSRNPSVNYEHWKDIGFAHTDRGNFLRKGVVGDWERLLSESQLKAFMQWEERSRKPIHPEFVYKLESSSTLR